jgi:hypothetical protein
MNHRPVDPGTPGAGGGLENGERPAVAPSGPQPLAPSPEGALEPVPSTRDPRRERRRQRTAVGLALAAFATAVTALALLLWGAYQWKALLDRDQAMAVEDEGTTRRTGLSPEVEKPEVDKDRDDPPIDVPAKTEIHDEGVITVVDVGLDAPALGRALSEQQLLAQRSGQTLLVMLTGRRCTPCRGVDAALADARMQEALTGVRLVRVDLEVFAEELRRLRLPTHLYPAFFLLGSDLRPVDAIHGGEWDEDVPANIAPVLGAFVKRSYVERRHYDWSPTTTSIPL